MYLFRSVLLVSLISFTAAFGLLFLGSLMGYEEFRGGYAVVSTDASIDDATVLYLLESDAGHFGGTPVSESSQWVLLDEFDSINKIPLNRYFERVFPFDPRNDGYAEKLKDIFIKDNRRFFYIPLQAGNWDAGLLDRQFNELLGDIDFSADYYGVGRPLNLFFIAYAAASFLLFIICLIKMKRSNGVSCIIALIPVLSSLAFFGAHGIACAAVFFAMYILLKDLRYELKIPSGASARGKTNVLKRIYKEGFYPYRSSWFFMLLFPAAFAVIIYFSQIKIFFFAAVFAASLIVFILSLKIISASRREHNRFNPVLIKRRRSPGFSFPVYILPFAAAAVFVIYASPYMSAAYESDKRFDDLITEKEYTDHINYQLSFSSRKINAAEASVTQSADMVNIPEFFFDTDGLLSISPRKSRSFDISEYPSFPLKNLMEFFNDVNSRQRTLAAGGSGSITGKLSLLVLLLFILPLFFIRKKNVNSLKIRLEKSKNKIIKSGKNHYKGINWNKKTMYNSKSLMSIQKDA